MDPSSALGRVVVLKNIVAKPELNSRYANVKEYNDERKRYLVRLIDHTSRALPVSPWVTADKFTFVHPRRFPDHADLRELDDDEDKLLPRYHTEQDSLYHPIYTLILRDIDGLNGKKGFFEKGLILGASGGGTDVNGLYLPRTRMKGPFGIKLSNNADILEIEDVFFDRTKDAGGDPCVHIVTGTVIFRRCRFEGVRGWGVGVEGTDESSLPHAVFENCVFKAGYSCHQGSASFLNCCFRNTSMNLRTTNMHIDSQSSVIVEYCDIRGGEWGIICNGKQSEVSHSIIRDAQIGVDVSKGNFCSLNDCLISNSARYGAQCGSATVHMTLCKVEQCRTGVIIGTTGSVSLVDSIIVDCEHGVYVCFDCVGTVAVNGCTFSRNFKDISHIGQAKCVVSVDGKIVEKNGVPEIEGFDFPGYIARNPENEHLIRRCLKKAGKSEFSPLCGHCGAQEPADAKYKKCSRCHNTAYCSLECQKAAWKTHKTTCVDASLLA